MGYILKKINHILNYKIIIINLQNMKEIIGLSYEQTERMQHAIRVGLLDDFEDDPRGWRHSFKGAYLVKYPNRVKHLQHIADIVGRMPSWEDITNDVIKDFVFETCESMATSSARTICAELKAFLNENRYKIPSDNFNEALTLRNEVSQNIYLTRDEMELFIDYEPRSRQERFAYRNFCVEMLTGARLCDCIGMSINNCDSETGMLSYVPQKTPNIIVRVPVDERHNLRKILTMTDLEECCLSSYNIIVRNICKKIGLYNECSITHAGKPVTASKWQLISSHTARRSFATNLYLAGVSLEDIALLMGHGKNVETTKRYICAERQVNDTIMSYFQDITLQDD